MTKEQLKSFHLNSIGWRSDSLKIASLNFGYANGINFNGLENMSIMKKQLSREFKIAKIIICTNGRYITGLKFYYKQPSFFAQNNY